MSTLPEYGTERVKSLVLDSIFWEMTNIYREFVYTDPFLHPIKWIRLQREHAALARLYFKIDDRAV